MRFQPEWLKLPQPGLYPPSGVSVESLLTSTARDDTPARAIKKLMRADLICIDDIDLLPVSNDTAEAVYRVVYAPYEKRTIALNPPGSTK